MTGRGWVPALCVAALLSAGCTVTVAGTATRPAPGLDEDSRSPVDVDSVLLTRAQMQAISGAGADLTAIPGTDTKVPVDLDTPILTKSIRTPCVWVYADTQVFGTEVEEFHKTNSQYPTRGGLISQAAAGYRDPSTARSAFDGIAALIRGCETTSQGVSLVGDVTQSADTVRTRTGNCGRDYRVKSVVLVEVTFCAFPDSVVDIMMTNIAGNIPG